MVIWKFLRLLWWLPALAGTVMLFWISSAIFTVWAPFEVQVINYASLSEAFLGHQLHLPIEPDDQVLSLENPYSPVERKDRGYLWDASLYNGKYYLYFGPVPALLFYIPYKKLLGMYPNDYVTIMVFSLIASALLFVACRLVSARLTRVHAPGPGVLWFLYVTFASSLPLQLGGGIYVVAATSGMVFQIVSLISLLMAMTAKRGTMVWSAVAGLATLCAIGSRPTHMVLAAVITVILLLMAIQREQRRRSIGRCVAFTIPIFFGCIALAVYNYLRFNDFTEFGLSYQLGVADFTQQALCSVRGMLEQPKLLAIQSWYLLLQYPKFSRSYPYLYFENVPHKDLPISVDGYLGTDPVTGLFAFSPLLIPGLLATVVYWRRLTGDARLFLTTCLVIGSVSLAYVHTCFFAAARYLFEIVSVLTIVCLPMLWIACSQANRRSARWMWRGVTLAGLIAGILMGALGTLDGHFHKGFYTAAELQPYELELRERLGLSPEPFIQEPVTMSEFPHEASGDIWTEDF